MSLPPFFASLSYLDIAAVLLLVIAWLVTGRLTEHPPAGRPSVSVLMADYRRDWMRQFVTRQPRIFDATVIDSLRQGTAFLASACMIAIGGGVALLGNSDRLEGVARDITPGIISDALEIRMILPLLLLANALLKFIWSNRLFGYCAILMASVPNDPNDPLAYHRAGQAAEVNITAAAAFNSGLRSIFFALGALAWLFGAVPLMLATVVAAGVLFRREFASRSREIILKRDL
ncbi:DUF599 domain-containing protein [Tabrizicola sp. J26]|uniref:DUF599 domain-containing protein n=1 Tax=Alitabrizicola rongguiensis TaxID=2909234 RepID=UPI001F3E499F|nr:DUF599 domain-containing protein [Tabrizicola rongguiensis]MCF1707462.1 DUF599 domain-containing protein [Tabrizicola rongguiensis]